MKMKKIFSLILTVLLLIGLAACNTVDNPSDADSQTRTITDAYGRKVEIPTNIESIICVGSGALRMVTYLDATDLLVGMEDADKEYEISTKRDYAHVYYEQFKNLPAVGKGGGTTYTAYPEEVIKVNPDVIICCYAQDAAEQLAKETGIPVVCIRWQSTNFIDETVYSALELLGDILNKQARCDEIISFIDTCKEDLNNRTKDVPDSEKPTVYTGAVTFSGAHGFAGTYANFGPFMAINAINVADATDEKSSFEVDLEKVLVWNPDIIFLDPGNMNLVNEEYAKNPNFFKSLKAVQNKEVYTMPSFNNYSTNITYAIMDAYFSGTVLYPEKFADIDIAEKSNEILEFFLGKGYYDEMVADGLGFGKLTIGE